MKNDILNALKAIETGDTPEMIKAYYSFGPKLSVFKGHFPGRPLLPGVFQIEMIRIAIEKFMGKCYNITNVNKAKFSGMIHPKQKIIMKAKINSTGELSHISAVFQVEQNVMANISLTLKEKEKSTCDG